MIRPWYNNRMRGVVLRCRLPVVILTGRFVPYSKHRLSSLPELARTKTPLRLRGTLAGSSHLKAAVSSKSCVELLVRLSSD